MKSMGAVFSLSFGLLLSQSVLALEIYRTGNPADVVTPTRESLCLSGGGYDEEWIDGWRYLIHSSGGGDILIIRADGERGEYEHWIYTDSDHHRFPRVNSVTTISLSSKRDGDEPAVVNQILKAEMIFFAGGDQSLYIDWLGGTRAERALNHQLHIKKIPFAGTSAGMAFLAGIDFSARYESPSEEGGIVTSEDVLKNPTGHFIDLDPRVLVPKHMRSVITETHFAARNRQARVVGFMANAIYKKLASVQQIRAVAADEDTAVCLNGNGIGRVYGKNEVYFLTANSAPEVIRANAPLEWNNNQSAVQVKRLRQSNAPFNFKTWSSPDGIEQFWWVEHGVLKER
ncbi:MAG: hypothetical protein BroJett040_03940 [Oligoflexia bacterium]|nr:MAG: hypothetical protein BroJett040_03940 [Oligoflexia bacterium]